MNFLGEMRRPVPAMRALCDVNGFLWEQYIPLVHLAPDEILRSDWPKSAAMRKSSYEVTTGAVLVHF